jgi:transcriptional repressor NrdR
MKCPFCSKSDTRVVDSRPDKMDSQVRRRRECKKCLKRFTTHEKFSQIPLIIVKKDGRREDFNRDKVLGGIKKACEKRAISIKLIEETVDRVEKDLRETTELEIPAKLVGGKIIEALKKIDDVAYVRFASVYREFKDVDDFFNELKGLVQRQDAAK